MPNFDQGENTTKFSKSKLLQKKKTIHVMSTRSKIPYYFKSNKNSKQNTMDLV